MISLLENGCITELSGGTNFSYILQDSGLFLSTEYKVLQSQANSCFVKCMKMLYNGKIQLYYVTNSLKPFSTMLASLDAESFLTIVANLFSDIIDVKHNGFLSCQNIDVSFEHIFVDPSTYKVSLVYLPLSKRVYEDSAAVENELRTGLIKLISGIASLSVPKTTQFSVDLSNGTLSLEDLYARIKGNKIPVNDNSPVKLNPLKTNVQSDNSVMRIVSMSTSERIELVVNEDEYLIGKNPAVVNGLITFNKMISRVHCKINKDADQYTITDLQSANGTYVNHVRLAPHQPQSIRSGDVIRLANSDFQIVIG